MSQVITARIPGIRFMLKPLTVFCLIPFRWNYTEERITEAPIWQSIYCLLTGPIFHSLQAVFIIAQFLKFLLNLSDKSIVSNINLLRIATLLTSATMTYTGYSILLIHTYLKRTETIKFVNELLNYRKYLTGTGCKLRNNIGPFVPLTFVLVSRTIAVTSVAILRPTKPPNAYSLLPQAWQTKETFAIFVIWHALSNAAGWMTVLFNLYILFLYVETIKAAMSRTIEEFHPRNILATIQSYKLWLVHRRLFEEAFGRSILPSFLFTMIILVILSTFGVVRFFGKILPNLYVYFLSPFAGINILIYSLLTSSAKVHEASEKIKILVSGTLTAYVKDETLQGSLSNRQNVLLKTKLRALPHFEVNVGPLFGIQRHTVLTMFGIIISNSINLLLNF